MSAVSLVLPSHSDLYYGGSWHPPFNGRYVDSCSPATGEALGRVADSAGEDADAIVAAATAGYRIWRDVPPLERAKIMRQAAAEIRRHGEELALIDSADGGNFSSRAGISLCVTIHTASKLTS